MRKKELVRACKIFVTAPKWGLTLPELSRSLLTSPDDLSVFPNFRRNALTQRYVVIPHFEKFAHVRSKVVGIDHCQGMFYLQQGVSVLS